MSITVRELTEIPYLRTWIHAGAAGADRQITWAHSIELTTPWEWLDAGDLLMTVGLGVPDGAEAQVNYVTRLAGIGVSGVAVADRMLAPPLTPEMVAAANEHALPLLLTAYEVPFVQVSRAVAAANQGPEQTRLVKAARIYDRVRSAVLEHSGPAKLLVTLGEELGCRLYACENDDGLALFPGAPQPPAAIRGAFLEEVARRTGAQPGIVRIAVGDDTVVVVPIPARRAASLVAVAAGTDAPPYALVQHAATAAALEAERLLATREELRRLGSETLAGLLDARVSPNAAAAQLRGHGLAQGPYVLLAATRDDGLDRSGSLHHALAERDVPNALLRRLEILYALLPAADDVVDRVVDLLHDRIRIGISDPFGELDGVTSAAREARWALEATSEDGLRVNRYGASRSLFGPRSISEARLAVEQVLGPVLAYDDAHGTELARSLAVFLRSNRSWQKATAELYIHKQTLVYRIRRVEQLTGRKLSSTGDVAELWLAIRALELLADGRIATPAGPS